MIPFRSHPFSLVKFLPSDHKYPMNLNELDIQSRMYHSFIVPIVEFERSDNGMYIKYKPYDSMIGKMCYTFETKLKYFQQLILCVYSLHELGYSNVEGVEELLWIQDDNLRIGGFPSVYKNRDYMREDINFLIKIYRIFFEDNPLERLLNYLKKGDLSRALSLFDHELEYIIDVEIVKREMISIGNYITILKKFFYNNMRKEKSRIFFTAVDLFYRSFEFSSGKYIILGSCIWISIILEKGYDTKLYDIILSWVNSFMETTSGQFDELILEIILYLKGNLHPDYLYERCPDVENLRYLYNEVVEDPEIYLSEVFDGPMEDLSEYRIEDLY